LQDSCFRELDLGFCTLVGILPAAVFWLTTPWGIGAAVDSVRYFQMAEIFLNADTLDRLGTHFPPLYPYLISLFTPYTDDISTAARILQCVLLALNGILAAVLVGVLTDRDRLAIFFTVLALTLRSEVFFLWHYAMSESLFSALLLAHYLCLMKWQRTYQVAWIFISGLLLGMMIFTRYAGIIFAVISVLVVVVQCRNLKITTAFKHFGTILFGVGSVIFSWYLVAQAAGVQRAPRAVGLYPVSTDNLELGLDTLWRWLDQGYGAIAGSLVAAIVVFSTWRFFKLRTSSSQFWIGLFITTIVAYILFVITALLLFDANIKLEGRIFYPSLLLFLISTTVILSTEIANVSRSQKFAFLIPLIFIAAASAPATYIRALTRIHQGEGFANALYMSMEIWNRSERYNNDLIVTNGPELVYLHMGRKATLLPAKYNKVTLAENPDLDRQLDELKREVLNGDATIIYFAAMRWRDDLPSAQRIADLMQIIPDYLHKKAMIYHVPDAGG